MDFLLQKILKGGSFLIALRRNSKIWTFYGVKIHKGGRPFQSPA